MSDNINITAGSGTTIATDQLAGGQHVQYVKLMDGTADSSNKWIVDKYGRAQTAISFADSSSIDAFGRVRVSNPTTIFDSKAIFDVNSLFWDDAATSGSGTSSTASTATASVTLGVSNTTAGTRTRQTKRRFNYQPGKSQLFICTAVMGTGVSGITKRVGAFDDNNGLFFEQEGTTLRVVVRTKTSGSVVNNGVDKADWNLDKMDGNGYSGINLDISKAQIFVIDYEWLGVGRVRFGFVINGIIYYCHQSVHANSVTTVYTSTPNFPIRYEIHNDGSGAADSLMQICSTVLSEGGQEELGLVRALDHGTTAINAASVATEYGAVGIRLKSSDLGATVKVIGISCMGTTNADYFRWRLILNPTITGTFTFADVTNSSLQLASNAATPPTITNGIVVNCGYCSQQSDVQVNFQNMLALGSKIDGTADILVLAVTPVSGTSQALFASMTVRELL